MYLPGAVNRVRAGAADAPALLNPGPSANGKTLAALEQR